MINIRGKHNEAIIYTDNVESSTISQITTLCNQEQFSGNKIRIMPDCHSGKGCVIGTTMTIKDAVTPNLVGIDIGCGMLAVKLKETRLDLTNIDSVIRKYVPSGSEVFSKPQSYESNIGELRCRKNGAGIRETLAYCSLGTLGGGNHFIEIDKEEDTGELWLIIHSGSRHIGIEVCNWYQNKAYEELVFKVNNGNYGTKSKEFIEKLKQEGKNQIINEELRKFKKNYVEKIPNTPYEMAFCVGETLKDYLHDMELVQDHAKANRSLIAKAIMKNAKLHEIERFETVHNYIDTENMILRKGAVSARQGERLVIPINMRDGSLICKGKGNEDWNFSAPHGAGRLFSRSDTKDRYSLSDYKRAMKESGVYTTSVSQSTLTECPMAYKSMESIVNNIGDTAEVVKVIKPIYNFKNSVAED